MTNKYHSIFRPFLSFTITLLIDFINLTSASSCFSPVNKMELWEEMKILAWSRCFVSIYTVCHLMVYIKVQTGVSGRFLYLQDAQTEEQLHWKLSLISRHMQCTEYPIREGRRFIQGLRKTLRASKFRIFSVDFSRI
jgi:Peroxin-3